MDHLNLCKSCENHEHVYGGDEVGTLAERCRHFRTTFQYPVKTCTAYESLNEPWIFGRDAWNFHSRKRNGVTEWRGFHPKTDYRVIDNWENFRPDDWDPRTGAKSVAVESVPSDGGGG